MIKTKKHPLFHQIVTKLRNKYNLTWLQVSMSYHKFPNLGQQFQSDLTQKLTKEMRSMYFMELPCNCNAKTKVDGKCMFKGDCQKSTVVNNAKCKICKISYFGYTQQKLKLRINQHLAEVYVMVNKGKALDYFSKYFTLHYPNREEKLGTGETRSIVDKAGWPMDTQVGILCTPIRLDHAMAKEETPLGAKLEAVEGYNSTDFLWGTGQIPNTLRRHTLSTRASGDGAYHIFL